MRIVWAISPAKIFSSLASLCSVASSTNGLSTLIVPTSPSPSRTGTQIKLNAPPAWDPSFSSPSSSRLFVRFRKSGCFAKSWITAGLPVSITRPVTPSPTAYRPRSCSAGVSPTDATVRNCSLARSSSTSDARWMSSRLLIRLIAR